ncbi:hypothetical protein PENSTE_c023G06002 [Penicillium steckii]|uniref:Zn(2)-C6 fungal-type domain-containing protein n=1 Tax=Penicillium steckii TaxID=303698 RepID=A0A1V6SSP7_9EURO|nr:hypothetical protein PENSTE_c023G06002 [Penicillium steckii]
MNTPVKRSYHGCARCKRRRQKCDEQKPSCGRCFNANETCEYKIVLKWNGRVPRKTKQSCQEERDICALGLQNSNGTNVSFENSNCKPQKDFDPYRPAILPPFNLKQPTSTLNPTSRLLLHHFITETSKISSSAYIRDQICQTILPMTHQSDSLLYATMAFAALHRYTLLNELPAQFMPENLVANLIAFSMRCLRRDLETPGYPVQPLLHTIRTLCHCEIFSGRASSSWRVHVNGAGAMFAEIASRRHLDESEYSFWLWSRWFWSIQALSATTDAGKLSELAPSASYIDDGDQRYFFDTYTGYSSDLNIVLMEIGLLMHKDDVETLSLSEEKSQCLEASIKYMIHRDTEFGLVLPDHILLDPNMTLQFQASNKAYQYSSLIHLYRRVRGLRSSSPEVQGCVRAILDSISAITPVTTLSPWILLTTPIFTAGCEAIGQDRKLVKELLQELYFTLHIRNIIRALEILERKWEDSDNLEYLPGKVTNDTTNAVDSSDWLDFIPY